MKISNLALIMSILCTATYSAYAYPPKTSTRERVLAKKLSQLQDVKEVLEGTLQEVREEMVTKDLAAPHSYTVAAHQRRKEFTELRKQIALLETEKNSFRQESDTYRCKLEKRLGEVRRHEQKISMLQKRYSELLAQISELQELRTHYVMSEKKAKEFETMVLELTNERDVLQSRLENMMDHHRDGIIDEDAIEKQCGAGRWYTFKIGAISAIVGAAGTYFYMKHKGNSNAPASTT